MQRHLKVIAVGTALTLGLATMPTRSHAGDKEWATVGKVLTGVAAVGVIAAIAHDAGHHRDYVYVDRCAPPTPPPPPPYYEHSQHWVPGHYETRTERICLPGYWDRVHVAAEYGWVRRGCRSEYVMIRPAYTRRVWVPERWETRTAQVWVPGRFETASYAYGR